MNPTEQRDKLVKEVDDLLKRIGEHAQVREAAVQADADAIEADQQLQSKLAAKDAAYKSEAAAINRVTEQSDYLRDVVSAISKGEPIPDRDPTP